MILVADCSALIALATCDALSLLDRLFGSVVLPQAVYREAVVGNKPEAEQLRVYLNGRVCALDPERPILLDGFSDPGETEAMLLYHQLQADCLLIDDRRGRRMARINDIQVGNVQAVMGKTQRGPTPIPGGRRRQRQHPELPVLPLIPCPDH